MLHWLGIKKYLEEGRTLPPHRLFTDLENRRSIAEDTLNLHSKSRILVAARELDAVQARLQQLRAEQHHPDEPDQLPGVSYFDNWEITFPEKLHRQNTSFLTSLFTLQRDITQEGGIDTRFMTWPEYFSVLLLSYCGVAFMRQPEPHVLQEGEEVLETREDQAYLDFAIHIRSEIIECFGYITAYEYASKLKVNLLPSPSRAKRATVNRIKKSFIDYYYRGYYTNQTDAASSFYNALPASEQNMLTEELLIEGLVFYEKANARTNLVQPAQDHFQQATPE